MRTSNALFAVLMGIAALQAAPSTADETVEHGPFSIAEAVLVGLRGTLEVRVVNNAAARLSVSGPADALAALKIEAADGVLRVVESANSHSVTVVDQVTVVTGAGANATVVIGGTGAASATPGQALAPVDLVLDLPVGTRLELEGFIGRASIGDLLGPVRLEAVDGTITAGAVRTAELAAIGNGDIAVESVAGDLAANVIGAGQISVRGGELDAVTVELTGAGTVLVDAPAASAVVNMVGAGEVRLAAVATPPAINRVGTGRFSAGTP